MEDQEFVCYVIDNNKTMCREHFTKNNVSEMIRVSSKCFVLPEETFVF